MTRHHTKADVVLTEQANDAITILRALALTYPSGHPDAMLLNDAASVASGRVMELLGVEPEAERPLRLVGE